MQREYPASGMQPGPHSDELSGERVVACPRNPWPPEKRTARGGLK